MTVAKAVSQSYIIMQAKKSITSFCNFSCAVLAIAILLSSCNSEPPKINFGKDLCDFCKMTIMDKKFGAAMVNKNGKVIKFDSGECMVNYLHTSDKFEPQQFLIVNYAVPEELINAEECFYLHGGNVKSPMGGQLAAFKTKTEAEKFQHEMQAELLQWNAVRKIEF